MRSPMEKQGITISILFILTILIVALLYTIPLPVLAGPPYLAHSQWDSGTAEFCVYEATLTKYVEPRPAKVKMIMVKEQFDSAKLVKTSTAEDSFEVIKFHTIQAIPTGIYDYFQTASIFFDRTTGRVVKYTMGSQEGCGNTFMDYTQRAGKGSFLFHSYWDDQGDETIEMDYAGEVFYDALPVTLRFRLAHGLTYKIRMIPSLISNKIVRPDPVEATIRVTVRKGAEVEALDRPELFEVTVSGTGVKDTFLFESAFPHRLVRWTKANGDRIELKKAYNLDYWNYKGVKDRALQKLD